MYTASWSETLKASSKMAFPKLPVTWSFPMPSAIVSYLCHALDAESYTCRLCYHIEILASSV